MRSRRLVEFLLFSLSKVGWHLSSSCELPGRDRDTLFFKQGPMVARAYFSVGFDDESTHSIKLIDAPNDAKQVFLDTLAVSLALAVCRVPGLAALSHMSQCEQRFMCAASNVHDLFPGVHPAGQVQHQQHWALHVTSR